jgi:AraC-like DNA-binding protein
LTDVSKNTGLAKVQMRWHSGLMPAANVKFKTILGFECEVINAHLDSSQFDRHFHNTFSMGLITSGMNAYTYHRKRVEAIQGTVCLVNPGDVHDGGLNGRAWSYIGILPPVEIFRMLSTEQGLHSELAFDRSVITDHTVTTTMKQLFMALLNQEQSSDSLDELAINGFSSLLQRHLVGAHGRKQGFDYQRLAQRSIEMIEDYQGKNLSLQNIAEEVDASRFAVIRAVNSAIGLTPVSYMTQLRVNHAKQLILEGIPITEAAYQSGFSDQSHLNRTMKRHWGVTPGTYKTSAKQRQR